MANWAGGLKRSLDFLLHFEAFWHCYLILFHYKHVEHHLFYPMTTDFMQICLETSAVLHVYICLYNRADIDDICVCLYLFISDLACLYNGMLISGYWCLYLDMDLYICSYNRHIWKPDLNRYNKAWKFGPIYLNYI